MNRVEEILAAARDVASHVTDDHATREAMAGDLIGLISLMIKAAGKSVAVAGESAMGCNDPECDCAANGCNDEALQDHTVYLVGERLQDGARWIDRSVRDRNGQLDYASDWKPKCRECGRRGDHKLDCATGRRPAADA